MQKGSRFETLLRGGASLAVLAIAVSALTAAADRERTDAAGFDLHLGKPVDLVRLNNVLNAMPVSERKAAAHFPRLGLAPGFS